MYGSRGGAAPRRQETFFYSDQRYALLTSSRGHSCKKEHIYFFSGLGKKQNMKPPRTETKNKPTRRVACALVFC